MEPGTFLHSHSALTQSLTQVLSSCWAGETDPEKLRNLPHDTRPEDLTLRHIFLSFHHSAYHWGFVSLRLQHFCCKTTFFFVLQNYFCWLFIPWLSSKHWSSFLALILLIYTCVISCSLRVFNDHAHRWFPNLSIKLSSLLTQIFMSSFLLESPEWVTCISLA